MAYVQGLGIQGATLGVMARATRSPVGGRVVKGWGGSARNSNKKLQIATASGRSSGPPIRVGGPPSKRGRRVAVSYTEDTKYTDTEDRAEDTEADDVQDATVVPELTITKPTDPATFTATTTTTSTSTTTSVMKKKEHYGREWHSAWVGKILKYGLPAMSIPVADPLLTMVDTLFVGQFCTVQELASLGPNGTVFPVMAYSFSFLSIAAIQRISSACAEGRQKDVGHLMRQAMLLSVVLGLALMVGAEVFAPQILKAVATNAEMFEPALLYMRIRCLAQPAVRSPYVRSRMGLSSEDNPCVVAMDKSVLASLPSIPTSQLGNILVREDSGSMNQSVS